MAARDSLVGAVNRSMIWIGIPACAKALCGEFWGCNMEGETLDTIWMTADVKIRWDRDPDEAITYLSPDGIAFIASMNGQSLARGH